MTHIKYNWNWPYIPTQISLQIDSENRHKRALNSLGIISNKELKNKLAEFVGVIKYPVTIYEFPPNNQANPFDTRGDSMYIYPFPPCQTLQSFIGDSHCKKIEKDYIRVFKGISKESTIDQINISSCKNIYSSLHTDFQVVLEKVKDRIIFKFDCPILGYHNFAFPIFVEYSFVGVLIIGEIPLIDKMIMMKSLPVLTLGNYLKLKSQSEKIKIIHNQWIEHTKINNEEYNTLIDKSVDILNNFESTLSTTVNSIRKDRINLFVDELIREFNEGIKKISVEKGRFIFNDTTFSKFWALVRKQIIKIRTEFSIKAISIFSIDKYIDMWTDGIHKLRLVITDDNILKGINPKSTEIIYDLDELPNGIRFGDKVILGNPTLGGTSKKIFYALKGYKLDEKIDIIRFIPAPFYLGGAMVIWIRFDITKWKPLGEQGPYRNLGKMLENCIRRYYEKVISALSTIVSGTSRELLLQENEILIHDIGERLEIAEKAAKQIIDQSLNNKDMKILYDQCQSAFYYTASIIKRSKLLVKGYPFSVEVLTLADINRLIYNLLLTYDFKLFYNKIIQLEDYGMYSNFKISTCYDLVYQALFGLIGNSIKHSSKGTNIYIKRKICNSKFMFVITNYCCYKLSQNRGIYNLFKRGESEEPGKGIGLYVVNQIAALLKGKVSHRVTTIAENVNLSIANYYIERFKSDSNKKQYISTLLNIVNNNIINIKDIIAVEENKRYCTDSMHNNDDDLTNLIKKPTFKVEFVFQIPMENNC